MTYKIMKGLKGVYLDTTEASFIDGEEGKLLYRGYNIHDLAEKSTRTYLRTTASKNLFTAIAQTPKHNDDCYAVHSIHLPGPFTREEAGSVVERSLPRLCIS